MAEVAQGAIVDGRYLIKDRIGSGGMADVYRAEDRQLGRDVALKILHRRFAQDREFVERFRREASAAAGLQHPNVVGVFDRGEHEGTYYIAMENLHGRTLKQLIHDEAPLPQLRAIELGVQILQAAGFAHRHGVIHRDFKPHNVIVAGDDRLKVTDFGIARAGASEMTETGSIMGTAQYLSPEQAQGQHVEATSDLYSIGVTIFEMLTGRVPFSGDSAVAIAVKHVSEPAPLLRTLRPDIHPLLEAAVARALEKDPDRRYQNADEFIAALTGAREALLSGDRGGGTELFAPPAPVPDRRGPRWPFVVLALALLLIAGVAIALGLSKGNGALETVPRVVGLREQAAASAVQRAGLKPVARGAPSSSVPPDTVTRESPGAGARVDKGSTVTLFVSTGPQQVIVPSVAGDTQAQAQQALQSSGLKPEVTQASSTTVKQGFAIDTSPPNGTAVRQGSRVTLIVSSGPQLITVPDFTGTSQSSATAQLQNLGLQSSTNQVSSYQPVGDVLSQSPTGGTQVTKGALVTLTVSKGPPSATVPDVTGESLGQARGDLGRAGFKVQVVRKPSSQPQGTVISQSPSGGDQPKGSTVTLTVAAPQKKGSSGGQSTPGAGNGQSQSGQ